MSFAQLKASRSTAIGKLVKAAEAASGGNKKFGDDAVWKPTVDKSNNGFAIIRFLPNPNAESTAWAQYWDHGFKGDTGRWFFEKSLTTLGKDCPVSEMNTRLWNQGDEGKELARKYKRSLHYASNILVVSDPGNPSNEGKVFKYIYGKKIFDKCMEAMQPQFDDEEAMNPFCPWEGADFKLKMRDVAGFRNYDKSEFAKPKPVGNDGAIEEVFDQLHSLDKYTDPAEFETYDALKAKLVACLGTKLALGEGAAAQMQAAPEQDAPEADEIPGLEPDSQAQVEAPSADAKEDDEQGLSYFAKMAEGTNLD